MEQYGGHKYAAGIKVKKAQYKQFKEKFEEVVGSTISKEAATKKVAIEGEIQLE